MADLVAALDGGGTKTQAAWVDDSGNVTLGRALAGCNPQDGADWAENLQQALRGLPTETVHTTLGIAGFGEVPKDDEQVLSLVAEGLTGTAEVLNDVALAYRGAFPSGGGVLILAGTGSMAMALGPKGLHRTGGWGDAYGDEGSAYWIGRAALALASKQADGRLHDSGFAAALSAKLGLPAKSDPFALLAWVTGLTHQRPTIAQVARHIDQMAQTGDADAISLLQSAAEELHQHMLAVAGLAGLLDSAPWACAGSVFNSDTLRSALAILRCQPPVEPVLDALGGGLWLAAKAAGWPVDQTWVTRMAASLAMAFSERAQQ
jgi:glucosamine kinase